MIRATRPAPPEYVERGFYRDRTLGSYLRDAATRNPGNRALSDGVRELTYAEAYAEVQAFARGLAARGLRRHDVGMVLLPNWWEAPVAIQAVLTLGSVINPVVPIYRDAEFDFILRQARPRAIVTPHRFRGFDYVEMFQRLLANLDDEPVVIVARPEGALPSGFIDFDSVASRGPDLEDAAAPEDVCLLLYTSGTTADPKGVLHSHQTLDYEVQSMAALAELGGDDHVFMPSPVSHITGIEIGILMPNFLGSGCRLVDIWDPERAVEIIEAERSAFCVGATPFLQGLTDAYEARGQPSALRAFLCGGADVPPELVRRARRVLDAWVTRIYGSSEFPSYCSGTPSSDERTCAETDGLPIGPVEGRLDDTVDGVGELHVRGPDMFLGYLDASLNADAFTDDGFFRTGDLAEIGPAGEVIIRGRKKDIILRGGENISVKQVEDALYEHPAVREVAVVAMPDPVMSERACAFVVPARAVPPTLAELAAFMSERGLAKQKCPERLEIVDSLPATASGKVQRYKLRETIRERLEREAEGQRGQ